jgi:hypothetical protein
MRIKISYSPILKIDTVQSGSDFEIDEGTSVSDLLRSCNVSDMHQRFIQIYVNGEQERLSYEFRDNDDLNLILPLGGG